MNDISRTNSIPWEGSYPLQRSQFWPIYFHTAVYQEILELAYLLFFFSEFFFCELLMLFCFLYIFFVFFIFKEIQERFDFFEQTQG